MAGYNNSITDINSKVGIGTGQTEPVSKLEVNTSVDDDGIMLDGTQTNTRLVIKNSSAPTTRRGMSFTNNSGVPGLILQRLNDNLTFSSNLVHFTTDAKVGIGVTNPGYSLQIGAGGSSGNNMMIEGTWDNVSPASNSRLNFNDPNFGIGAGQYADAASHDALCLWGYAGAGRGILFSHTTGGATQTIQSMRHDMFIDGATGNIGINNVDPITKLHIQSGDLTTNFTEVIKLSNTVGIGGGPSVFFKTSGADSVGRYGVKLGAVRSDSNNGSSVFKIQQELVNSGGTLLGLQDVFTIDQYGRAGISTTTPTAKLHIAKTTTWGEMSNPIINIQNNGTGGDINTAHNMGSITWKSGTVSTAEIKAVRNTPASGDNVELRFSTSAAGVQGERMTINNNGIVFINNSLGVNVTSITTGYKLVVGGGDISANQAVAKISLGQIGSQGDAHFGASGLPAPTVGSQDYGFYSAHNAYRTSTGAWKHSRTSTIGAVRLLGGGGGSSGNSGFSFDYSANNGSSDITWTSLMQLSTAGNLQLPSYGAGTLVTDASGNISVSSGGGAGGPYLPVANPTFTGTLTGPNATFTGQLQGNDVTFGGEVIVNDNFVNYEFTALDNVAVQYWLLCFNGGTNDVNGTLIGDRTSGHHQAMNLDIVISAKSAGMQTGMLTTKQVLESNEKYTLVTLTYNSNNYVAIKYEGHPYPISGNGYFTGLLKSNIGSDFLLAVNGASVSSVAAFSNLNTKATIQADKVGIGTADPGAQLQVEGAATADDTAQLIVSSGGADNNAIIHFTDDDGGQVNAIGALEGNILTFASVNELVFKTDTSSILGNNETRMTIDSSGNVGIGTITPDALFDVADRVEIDTYAAQATGNNPFTSGYLRIIAGAKTGWGVDDELGKIEFYGEDTSGVGARTAASIIAVCENGNGTSTTTFSSGLAFYTSPSNAAQEERIRITDGGDVGIGVTNPTVKLWVNQGNVSGTVIKATGIQAQIEIQTSTAGDAHLYMRPNATGNNAAIFKMTAGTNYNWRWQDDATTPVVFMKLQQSTGTLTVTGDLVAYGSPSDKKLKENIKPIESALDKVTKLQGVTFDWKESNSILDIKEDIGFIAQDVQKVVPELVRENKNGMLSMRHQGIAPILLEAIKELKAEIDLLKSKPCTCNNCNCNI